MMTNFETEVVLGTATTVVAALGFVVRKVWLIAGDRQKFLDTFEIIKCQFEDLAERVRENKDEIRYWKEATVVLHERIVKVEAKCEQKCLQVESLGQAIDDLRDVSQKMERYLSSKGAE